MIIRNLEKNIISKNVKLAQSFSERLIGLMFRPPMQEYDSLLIKKCNSIHTFFMKYPIDLVFLSSDFTVVRIYRNLAPWRLTRIVFGATQVLEMESGKLDTNIKVGERLEYV